MKNSKSIVLALMLMAGIFACKKSDDTNPSSNGTVTVTIGQATISETSITVPVVVSGNATIVQRGVCWDSIQTTPTISNHKKADPGTTVGSFSVLIDQLSPATTYNVRSYVTTNSGTVYSLARVYTTGSAQLTIDGVNNITDTSASINASLNYSGALQVGARGFCWGTQASPDIFSVNHDTIGSGTGNFSTTIKGLQTNTKYYVRAYAIIGTGNVIYSAERDFFTATPVTVVDIDGNTYNIVKIGQQFWMQENLRTATYNNGTTILTGLNDADWTSNISGACADYDDVPANSSVSGKLYNPYAVANPAGLCPTGWHVATNSDWNKVAKIVDAIADTTITNDAQSLTGGSAIKDFPGSTNSTGLSIVPGGTRYPTYDAYDFGYYWTGTASVRVFYSIDDEIKAFDIWDPMWGLSVRCVKN